MGDESKGGNGTPIPEGDEAQGVDTCNELTGIRDEEADVDVEGVAEFCNCVSCSLSCTSSSSIAFILVRPEVDLGAESLVADGVLRVSDMRAVGGLRTLFDSRLAVLGIFQEEKQVLMV